MLLTGAAMLLAALVELQRTNTGYNLRQVLALDVPLPIEAYGPKAIDFYQEATRRIEALPGVERVAVGNFVPWRDKGMQLPRFQFTVEGYTPAEGEENPHARFRNVTPGFFAALGVPLVAGRDFTEDDRRGSEPVVIVSQSVARRLFPGGDAIDRRFWWTEPMFGHKTPRRIVGVVADVDDENIVPGPALIVYHPLRQLPAGGRLFVHASGDPYALVAPVTRTIREISAEQPVERAATLADVRAEVLAPNRLNAFVLSGFALRRAADRRRRRRGRAGVLGERPHARVRRAARARLVARAACCQVLVEGALIATVGIAAGAVAGYALGRVFADYGLRFDWPLLGAAVVLMAAAVAASLVPAARASRVDVVQALRSECME